MTKPLEDEPLRSSILDRLSGPSNQGRFAGRQTLEQLLDSIHRDLEQLLNTRWRVTAWPLDLEELQHSLVNYGIPDFAGISMSSPAERELFRDLVEESLRLHEPRFLRVQVKLIENQDRLDRTIRFKIDATVKADPEPAEVQFDSHVDSNSRRIEVNAIR
jgi:type VI secretion system protein ImpF